MNSTLCKYQCENCKYYFEEENPHPVVCPKCGNFYVKWINFKEVLNYLVKTNNDYKKQYPMGFKS